MSSGSGTNIFWGDEDTNSYQGNVIEYMLPYVFYIVVLLIIKLKDANNRNLNDELVVSQENLTHHPSFNLKRLTGHLNGELVLRSIIQNALDLTN